MRTPVDKAPEGHGIDPITASVILGALENIAVEMGYKLMRMSYSSIIRESEDFGTALVNARGEQLCESKQSTPLQYGPIPGYVRGMLDALAKRGESILPGDVIMHNDPYGVASHGPDVGFGVPVFYQDEFVGFSVTTAHHLDIGCQTPGSTGIVEAFDAYAEGLQFKAIKVFEQGKRNAAVWQLLRDNIRISDLVVGDMEAQIAACRIGAQRYIELIERYGLQTVEAACASLFDYSERLMRQAIEQIPDGSYAATGHMDGYIDDPDPSRRNLPICVTLTVSGSELRVDLTGTAPQVSDRPINMPRVGTVDVAIWLVLRSVLLDTEVYGDLPQNAGLVLDGHLLERALDPGHDLALALCQIGAYLRIVCVSCGGGRHRGGLHQRLLREIVGVGVSRVITVKNAHAPADVVALRCILQTALVQGQGKTLFVFQVDFCQVAAVRERGVQYLADRFSRKHRFSCHYSLSGP